MYDKLEIEHVLEQIKLLIQRKSYTISTGKNREANDEFMYEFKLNNEKICTLLMQIKYSD